MKKSDLDGSDLTKDESLHFRFLGSASPSEIEAACLYEYMRESQTLRDGITGERKSGQGLPSPFLPNLTLPRLGYLIVKLQSAGFPKPWKQLSKRFQTLLVLLLVTGAKRPGDTKLYPPVIFEQGWPEFDSSENCWRVRQLEPFELSLFKRWEHSGRKCFFGFIRIDTDYNETEAVEAFRNEFRNRWPKTKGGGARQYRDLLNKLAVMRIWKRFPNPNKRVTQIAGLLTGFKGCRAYLEERRKAIREKREVEQRISNTAKAEMSRARSEARTFFQSLFPAEEPLSYRPGKLTATGSW